jgi:hypothetical protein
MSDNTVHRLLDEAFADVEMTPETQDLKEEIRANLMDRVSELTASGVAPEEAARRAVGELGDVHELIEEASGPTAGIRPVDGSPSAPSAAELVARNRVPRKPSYVAVVVLMSIVLTASVVGTIFAAVGVAHRDIGLGLPTGAALVAGAALGWVVGASLAQETTVNHPMPAGRAVLFGVGWGLVLAACLLAVVHLFGARYMWFAVDGLTLVAGVVLLAYLAATTTNRKKQWALAEARRHVEVGNRFEEDPNAAARFGIYTVAVWTVIAAAFLTVGFTVNWLWALLPILLGFAVHMLILARMLFGQPSKN